ncbi:hypothetical protein NBO_1315g0001 [Nosema bombycis CQ1]|uniref:Uncharacterized protein n=1 Tax=Nosema bombycis (strain CQ1 / CVCC 102059) TaxID=578461 RepID=R0MB69_NOSB1|nr:hypothetical protein NBO_1315g0001 [Nosema bombycis CQ1]|eukprot:EOB11280.1 hypothetical protein NBO_1315g0001 [Nosema bombycis CQ1]
MKINRTINYFIFIFYTTTSCSFCPYFIEPDLSKDAMGPMLTCIQDDFTSSRFFKFKLKKEKISELVILIDVIGFEEFNLTTIKRNLKGKIETKTHKYLLSFKDSICGIIKRNFNKDKCDIYFYHFNIDLPFPNPEVINYKTISRDRFSSIQIAITRMGHRIQLLPRAIKTLSKKELKCLKYFHFYWEKADYIVPLFAKENRDDFDKFFKILEKHRARKLNFIKKHVLSSSEIDLFSNFAINTIYDAIFLRRKVEIKNKVPLKLNDILLILRSTINLFKISKQTFKNLENEFANFSYQEKMQVKEFFDSSKFEDFIHTHTIDPFFFPETVDIPNLSVLAQCCESIYKSLEQGIFNLDVMLRESESFLRLIFLLITINIKKLVENTFELQKDPFERTDFKVFYCFNYKKYWLKTFKDWLACNTSEIFTSQEDNFRSFFEKYIKHFDTTPNRNIFEYSQLLREYLLGDFYY